MQNCGRGQPGRGRPNRGHHGGRGGPPNCDRNYLSDFRSEGYIDEYSNDHYRGRGGYMDMPRGRGSAMDTHSGRGGAMDTHRGRGGAMDTHRGRGGAMDTDRGRGGSMDTHRGRGGSMDTHRGRGGSMDTHRGRGGSMDTHRGRGGSMDNYRGRGGSMDNYRGRGACMESYRGRGDFVDNYRGRGGSVDNPRGRGGSLQRGRGGMQRGRGSYSNMDQEYMPGPMAAQMAQPPMGPYTTQPPLMMQPPPMAPYMTQPPVAQQMNQPQMVPYMTQSQQIMQPPMASYMTQTPVAQLMNQPQMGPYMTQPPIPPLMTQPSNRRNMDRGRRRQYANQHGGQRMNVKGNVEGRSMAENGRGRYNYRKVPGAHKRGNPASRRRGNLKVFDDTASETSSVVSYVSSVDSEEDVDNLSEDLKEVRRENRGPYRRFADRRYNFSGRSFRGGRAFNRQRGKSGYVVACSPSREKKDDNDGYTTSSVESAEDSDNSEISIESETSVGEKTNPVLAGTDGLDTLSIKTMRNRIFRYKRKLAELRKKPIPDLVQINELEDVVAEINAKVNLRMEEERKITERKNRGTKNYDSKHKRKSGERNNNPRKTKGVEDDDQYNKDNEEPENISSEGTVISESENEAIKEKIKPRKKTHTTIIAKKGITSFKPNSKTRVINKSGKLPKNTGVIEKIKEAWDEENKSDFGESKDNSERKSAVKQKIRTKTTAKDTVTDTVTDDAMEHKEKKTNSDKSRNRRKREITNQNNAKDAVKEVKDDGLEIEGTNSDCNESTHSSDKKPTARKNKIKKRNNKDDTHIEDDSKEVEKLFSTLDDLCASTPNKLPDQKPTSSAQGTGNQRKQSLNAKQLSEVTTSPVSSIHSISDAHTIGKPVRVTNRRESEGSNPDTRNYSKNGPNDIDVFKFLVLEMHSVGTIDDIKAKSQLFQDVDAYEWFRHNNRRFTLLERDGKITTVFGLVRDTSYCLSYITIRSCKEINCKHYHICKNLLSGKCTFGENCKFSHNVFDDRNIAVTKRLGLDNVFNNEQIVALLSVRYPRVCDNWNEPDSCPDSLCTNLHLCKLHVQRNCLNGEQCKLEHLHSTNHNKPIVAAYRMERLNDIMFHKLIFLQKLGTLEERQNPEKSARADDKKGDDPVSNVKSVESSVSVADDGPAGKAHIRQDSRAVPKPLHTRPNRQKVGETTNNDDLKLVADSASETFICEQQFLTGRCSNRGCRLLHSNGLRLPYIWQVKLYDAWTSVDDSCVVESSFCDPRIRSSQVTMVDKHGTSQTVTINFDDDGRFFAQCALGELPTRRLSTKSYGSLKVQPSSFLTRWVWYWLDDDGGWRPFDTDTLQYTLESKYQFGQETFLYSRDNYRFKYSLDFTTMKQFNIDTRKARTVTRRPTYVSVDDVHKGTLPSISIPRAPAPLPATWAPWDLSHPFELVELNMDDADYITVEKSFYTTLRREEEVINHIYRVQCASLWSKLESHRKSMVAAAERAGRVSAIDERKLFHGTDSLDVVRGICINNFDPRMSGKNATRYGEGAYFHKNAKYSHAYTGNNPAERFMFQTIVLIGDFVLGDPAYRRPPARPGAAHELYDSCVDRMSDPTIFVAFDRDQQYPEYLIQYHDNQQPEGPVVEERPAPPRPTTNPSTGAMSYPSVGAMSYPSQGTQSYPASQVSYPAPTSRRQRASKSVKEEKGCSIQ